jgi:hypothetical protein
LQKVIIGKNRIGMGEPDVDQFIQYGEIHRIIMINRRIQIEIRSVFDLLSFLGTAK